MTEATTDSYWAYSEALAGVGLHPMGLARSEEFHVGVAEIAADAIRRIEEMMEGEMSEDMKTLFHLVAERTAHTVGPQLEVTYP